MSFIERLKRKREIASINLSSDLVTALELNILNLQDVRAIREMSETEGWQMIAYELRKDLANKQKQLEDLSVTPETEKYRLAYYGATCALIRRILSFVEGVLKQEKPLLDEQNRLRDAATNTNQGA